MRVFLLRGLLLLVAVLGKAVGARAHRPMREFEPDHLARFETENWVYYYQKRWLPLFRIITGTLRAAFGLSWPEALRCAYWGARAEVAAAPKEADYAVAEAYMRKFYRTVRRRSGERFDPRKVAALDVRWWVIHRQLAIAHDENKQPLEDALTAYNAALYGVDPAALRESAHYRALAMTLCDRWVEEGRQTGAPLLAEIEAALHTCYHSLHDAVAIDHAIAVD